MIHMAREQLGKLDAKELPPADAPSKNQATQLALGLLFGSLVIGLFTLLRWGLVLSTLLLGFALIYYLAPHVDRPLRLITLGSEINIVFDQHRLGATPETEARPEASPNAASSNRPQRKAIPEIKRR